MTEPVDLFSDDRPEMQFASAMDATTAAPPQAPTPDAPSTLSGDVLAMFSMFLTLSPAQRLEFNAANMRTFCAGCGHELPKDGAVCRICND